MKKLIPFIILAAIAANAAFAGTITGTVTDDSNGLPIQGLWVDAYDYNTGSYANGDSTDANGVYVIDELATGNYKVYVWTSGTEFIPELYDNQHSWDLATPVNVTEGQQTTGIDFELAKWGTITGRVTDSNGLPISNLLVYAVDYNTGSGYGSYTDSNGIYINQLAAGTYRVNISIGGSSYVMEYYNNVRDYDMATPVNVTEGRQTTGIDFELTVGGSISGRVTDSNGVPISNLLVYAYDYNTESYGNSGNTDSNGIYIINQLATDSYRVVAETYDTEFIREFYDNQLSWDMAVPVNVTEGLQTTGIDFELALAGSITGRVTDSNGLPISNLWVNANDFNTGSGLSSHTDSNGVYTITGLAAGAYRVSTGGSIYIEEYYNNTFDYENATPVNVTEGQQTIGIDFELTTGGSITGRVTDSNGLPISNLQVSVYNFNTGNGRYSYTDSNGFYIINRLATGSYRVVAYTYGTEFVEEYYDNQLNWDLATPVNVTEGLQTTGIDFELVLAGSITGRVTDSNGQPIQNLWVYAIDYANQYHGNNPDSNGFYSITGLPAGTYRVWVWTGNTNYIAEYYNNQLNWDLATPVNVSESQQTTDIDFELALAGSISGRVTDSNGLPIADIQVNASEYDTGYGNGDRTDSNGFYIINRLVAGTYRLNVDAQNTNYISQIYDHQTNWDNATPVAVSAAEAVQNINFSLELGASISGVVKNSAGIGQANVQVNCWADDGYGTGVQTEANGFYKCSGLPVGYNYNVIAHPPADSNYMITKITVDVYQPGEYTGKDIVLNDGGLKISGKITDKATTLPLADVQVGCWNDDVEIWTDTITDANGMYLLTNLPAGEEVGIEIRPDSYYAYMGAGDFELEEDINNFDFALPAGAILSGKVVDADTAQPIANVEIEYDNERYNAYRNTFTGADGIFCLTQLPPGIAELKAMPDVDSGYAWNLPWGSDFISLNEGENRSEQIIALEKGALVRGYLKDANGNAFKGIEYYYTGKKCDGWGDPDVNGFYQIRLPVGTSYIEPDDEEMGVLPLIVTITDVNDDINVPDIIIYTEATGGKISGDVNNPGGYGKTGVFYVTAFKAGTTVGDPNIWYALQPVSENEMENAGAFSLANLPPDTNYDIYLFTDNYTTDDIESLAVQDVVLNVAAGTTGINLEYSSEGSTVRGYVKNADGRAILGASVLLSDSLNIFRGFGQVDSDGLYIIYNVPVGTYTATTVHSKYISTSTIITVVANGTTIDVGDIVIPFEGGKEGPDLNGNGIIDLFDIAEFGSQWLDAGTNEANFNRDGIVNFLDWLPLADNWLWKAIWLND